MPYSVSIVFYPLKNLEDITHNEFLVSLMETFFVMMPRIVKRFKGLISKRSKDHAFNLYIK